MSKAIELAIQSGLDEDLYLRDGGIDIKKVETFYTLAKADALREAAKWFDGLGDQEWFTGGVCDKLKEMAEEQAKAAGNAT